MSNPLPKDKPLTSHRLLKVVAQVLEVIRQDGTGHIPTIKKRTHTALTVTFDENTEFIISVKNQSNFQ